VQVITRGANLQYGVRLLEQIARQSPHVLLQHQQKLKVLRS
jgi:hypothetical protein